MRHLDGRFMASAPHYLDQGPEPAAGYDLDLTPWLDAPSVHELVGRIREVRDDAGGCRGTGTRRCWPR